MSDATNPPAGAGFLRRTWLGMGSRLGWGLGLIVALIFCFASYAVFEWWTAWPARLILRGTNWQYPVAYSPDGSLLATRSDKPEEIILWDPTSGRKRATWPVADKRFRFWGSFSPDGKSFASPWFVRNSGGNFSVDLIDVPSGVIRSTFTSPSGGFLDLRFLDAGRTVRLLSTGDIGANGQTGMSLTDVDVASGRIRGQRTLSVPTPSGFSKASNDGRLMAWTDDSFAARTKGPTIVKFWDLDQDREVRRLPPIVPKVIARALAFSPDDRSLAIGLEDGSIQVWDVAACRLRSTLRGHSGNYSPFQLTFSPDGSRLASLGHFSNDSPSVDLLRVYLTRFFPNPDREMETELVLLDLANGDRLVQSKWDGIAVFSPDGRSIATGHDDETVRIHDLPPRKAQAEAR